MKLRIALLTLVVTGLWTIAALAVGPIASPEGVVSGILAHELPIPTNKLSANPGDLLAGAEAGADYIRYMQADYTEDNAGNGLSDSDTQDAGWDWSTTIFQHQDAASPTNLYGVTANGIFQTYQFSPTDELFIAMEDAANHIVNTGPNDPGGIRSAADVIFLLDFATLAEVTNPAFYVAGADVIWQRHLTTYTSAKLFAEYIRDARGASYPNGIIPWDIGAWVIAVQNLSDVSVGIYDTDADDIAEVLYQDSFVDKIFFDPHGANKGADAGWADVRFWWYTNGVTGLIDAFMAADVHTAELTGLETLLHECQYDWGAFSHQYGANSTFNDADDQTTAYACMTLDRMDATTINQDALYNGAWVLSYWQDASGGMVYTGGNHYPEIGGECTAAMALGWKSFGSVISATASGADPAQCDVDKIVTFNYAPMASTPGLRGYELTLEVTGPVDAFGVAQFADLGIFSGFPSHYFRVIDNGDGTWTVNDAILGATGGLTSAADMFSLTLHTNGDGVVDVNVLSYKLRDPDNADLFADVSGTSFTVDCTAPGAVDSFTGAPGHEKADLAWTMADISDVAAFEIYRAVWYDGGNAYTSAYPEYDDLANDIIPGRPGSRAAADASGEWTLVYTTLLPTEVAYTDNESVRGIYYYEIFAKDAAGNYGPPAADPVWVMNYWLGDVSDGLYTQFDGEVKAADITALGSFFGMTNIGLNHVGNHVDVGPTHDTSRLGIPDTDDDINFEDLMIFAMNYGVVSAAKSQTAPGSTAYLAWAQLADGSYVVRVTQGNGLKGLRVTGDVNIIGVSAGTLIAEQEEMTFLANVGSRLDANVAVMGMDLGFVGEGDLLIIKSAGTLNFEDLKFEARGFDNSRMEVSFEQASGNIVLPRVFNLSANFPNPFNPQTNISFSLPEAQDVKLTVYGLDGRKVATLINGRRDAGIHEVTWMGRNDRDQLVASGTYFYRLDAGPYSQVRKMTLMK